MQSQSLWYVLVAACIAGCAGEEKVCTDSRPALQGVLGGTAHTQNTSKVTSSAYKQAALPISKTVTFKLGLYVNVCLPSGLSMLIVPVQREKVLVSRNLFLYGFR